MFESPARIWYNVSKNLQVLEGSSLNKKSAARTAAVIEIGSNNVRMHVSQLSKDQVVTLDQLEYPVGLGHDVFADGLISFESLRELSAVLGKFSAALLSYRVEKPKVISCTALREARNRSLVADQLRVRNGLEVQVLEDSQEKAYIYSEIIKKLSGRPPLSGNTMIAYIGSGSIGVAVFDGARIIYSQNISMGASKLHDVLRGLRTRAEDFHIILEEYMDTILNRVDIASFQVQNLVLTGSQIGLVTKLCGALATPVPAIPTSKLSALFQSVRSLTAESIANRFAIPEEKAAVLYTALFIYHGMLRFCPGAKSFLAPVVDISEAVVRYLLIPKAGAEWDAYLQQSALACAEQTALRFGCDLDHCRFISGFACKIFDKMKRVHGLDPSKRLILQLAATLHSCGRFVSVRQHNRCTFDLIKGMDIFGLSSSEVLEVAFVAGSISNNLAVEENPDFSLLSNEEKLVISKLAAMFRMANALDKSHRAKLRDLKVSMEEDRVIFKAEASGNTLLERWSFRESAAFFTDVFGLSPELTVKLTMLS